MKFLQQLLVEKKEDLSKLPKDVMSAIKKNIRKGAEDLEQKWANALELVHRAYEIEGIQRPNPTMESAWKQYEENLAYAVQQLASNRGMEDDWRMSSAVFHEALKGQDRFRIEVQSSDYKDVNILEASSLEDVLSYIKENTDYDVLVEQEGSDNATVKFSRWGIRENFKVNINKIYS